MRRNISACLLLLAATSAWSDPIVTKFYFSGNEVGENTYEEKPDGEFTSHTKFKIMTQDVDGTITGHWNKGRLADYKIDELLSGTKVAIEAKGGKVTATVNGKPQPPADYSYTGTNYFSNFHPQLIRGLVDGYDPSTPGAKKIKVFALDGGTAVDCQVIFKPARTITKAGQRMSAKVVTLRIGTVDIELAYGDGKTLGMGVPTQMFEERAVGYDDIFVDPTTKFKELSQPTFKTSTESKIWIPMRDGVRLMADIVKPKGDGKFPVILVRTPYGRTAQILQGDFWAKRGYIYVAQDVRGRDDSEGEWHPFMPERKDGYDTIDWISKQPWCDGNVGMIGGSYLGLVQWAAAVERHPALKCIIPQVSPPDAFFNIPYDHGAFMLWANLWWLNIVKEKQTNMGNAIKPLLHPEKFDTLPLSKVDDAVMGQNIPAFDDWLKRDRPSQFAGFDYGKDLKNVTIPALHISGWWDGDGIGTKRNWATMRAAGNKKQWLVYGPWTHAFNTTTRMGDVDYGPNAILELDSLYLRWFDTWLKHKQVGIEKVPKVQAFVTGANQWRKMDDWPPSNSKPSALYLGGAPSGASHPGTLTWNASKNKPATYTYDPSKLKVPKELLNLSAASEPDTKAELKDFKGLYFESSKLSKPLTIGGPLEADLYFSLDTKDTDFMVNVVDVNPHGVRHVISMAGKIRAMYVNGWETPAALQPGKIYRAHVEIWDTAHQFAAGHRIGVMLQSHAFPFYARNLNTGEPLFNATKMVTAHPKIYMDKAHPSALRFMVLPEK